jgi:hypothetical protein
VVYISNRLSGFSGKHMAGDVAYDGMLTKEKKRKEKCDLQAEGDRDSSNRESSPMRLN